MEKLYRQEYNVETNEVKLIEITEDEIQQFNQSAMETVANIPYTQKRAIEYPSFTEYLDGIVKGDQQQIQNYIDACLAVKEKYPKPKE